MRRITIEITVDLQDDEMIQQIDVATECPTGTHVHNTTDFKIVNFWPLSSAPSSLHNEPPIGGAKFAADILPQITDDVRREKLQ